MKLGRNAEAKLIHEELLEFYSKHYEKTDPLVLKTKYNIAYSLFKEGNLKPKELFKEVVQGEYEH